MFRSLFALLKRTWREDDDFQPVVRYFEKTYVNGTPGRGRHPAVPATYAPNIWIHYQSALDRTHKTNNVSEAWHNRFAVVVGKHHPDIYSTLTEIQKEQADTGSMAAELSIGEKVRAWPEAEVG